ncbi:trimeric autotransporter adhesin [Arcicella aurantiaca]|uniref:Trimeric autotransporter adhesin n=1 Tax=Arcicella aurantiaca TaxID=591202 RepID=A0A316EJC9_9BACT|nr:tail fiber domain-containing protein [Arcicella aurantiaca]PWK28949.1 trimeric autotransporter adhesin [Arcicella aurantiaca]
MPLSNTTYTDAAGILYDPSGPNAPYPSGSINTTTTIYNSLPSIVSIKLVFETFDTEANGDSVIILDNGSKVIAKYSGNNLPPDLLYDGSYIGIKFKTNGNSVVGQGFKIRWYMIEQDITSTPITEAVGNALFFDSTKGAFRSGRTVTSANQSEIIGKYSIGIGYNNHAQGFSSISMGTQTLASGPYSTAIGSNVTASNYYTVALGFATECRGYTSTALGSFLKSLGQASTALGYYGTASGDYSTVMGAYSNATANTATSMGYSTRASGDYSTAIGAYTNASGYVSTTMGYSTYASGYASLATGYNTNATSNAYYGTAMGYYTTASSTASFASGSQTISSGYASTSMGYNSNASGYVSTALGNNTNASGYIATAMGTGTVASGFASTAMGYNTIANGNNSTAIGSNVNAYYEGSFVIGDSPNSSSYLYSFNPNTFSARFRNGYYLYTSATLGTGAILYGGSNSWSSISDSTKKENFQPIDGENVLKKIANMRTVTWNYKGQDPKLFRHYGPMAQEFFSAFGRDKLGVVGNDTTIASADFDGVNFTAIKALEKRTSDLQAENELLKKRLVLLEKSNAEISILKLEMEELKALLLPEREKISAKKVSEK